MGVPVEPDVGKTRWPRRFEPPATKAQGVGAHIRLGRQGQLAEVGDAPAVEVDVGESLAIVGHLARGEGEDLPHARGGELVQTIGTPPLPRLPCRGAFRPIASKANAPSVAAVERDGQVLGPNRQVGVDRRRGAHGLAGVPPLAVTGKPVRSGLPGRGDRIPGGPLGDEAGAADALDGLGLLSQGTVHALGELARTKAHERGDTHAPAREDPPPLRTAQPTIGRPLAAASRSEIGALSTELVCR